MTQVDILHSEPVELLRKLVGIYSVFPHEQEISSYVESLLLELGFSVQKVKTGADRFSLVGTFGKSKDYLGFYGHVDTVPPASDYVRDPFKLEVGGNIGRGLGSVDMKGGLACILHAAAWAKSQNLPVKVVFGVDEEDISQGAHDLVSSGFLSDIRFLIVAESGQIQDYNQAFSVCLGRKGRIVYQARVQGVAAHAADAHKGVNAIEKAAVLIGELSRIKFPAHAKLGSSSIVVQKISATTGGFSVPDSCELAISLLTTPNISSADFEREVHVIAKRNQIMLSLGQFERATPYGESYEIDLKNPFYLKLEKNVVEPAGVKPVYTSSVADENVFANRLRIPVLTIGAIGDGDHTKDEWVNLDSLARVIEVYRTAIRMWNE
jgi:acetylornithine deacetylase/succinyl-diaminopimelate desuccinylase-like protein